MTVSKSAVSQSVSAPGPAMLAEIIRHQIDGLIVARSARSTASNWTYA